MAVSSVQAEKNKGDDGHVVLPRGYLAATEDIAISFLWAKVYRQIHLALVNSKDEQGVIRCGVAFPEYSDVQPTLGRTLRLLASEESDLQHLNLTDALKHLAPDYVKIKAIHPYPSGMQGVRDIQSLSARGGCCTKS